METPVRTLTICTLYLLFWGQVNATDWVVWGGGGFSCKDYIALVKRHRWGKTKVHRQNMFQCCFVNHKSHIVLPTNELGHPTWAGLQMNWATFVRPVANSMSHDTACPKWTNSTPPSTLKCTHGHKLDRGLHHMTNYRLVQCTKAGAEGLTFKQPRWYLTFCALFTKTISLGHKKTKLLKSIWWKIKLRLCTML
jgi:hypothetical protein